MYQCQAQVHTQELIPSLQGMFSLSLSLSMVDVCVLYTCMGKCCFITNYVHLNSVMLRPLSETSTHAIMMTNTDPKFNYIPYSLLNWATKVLSWTMWTVSFLQTYARELGWGKSWDSFSFLFFSFLFFPFLSIPFHSFSIPFFDFVGRLWSDRQER